MDPVKSIDSNVLHTEKNKIMERWKEHFNLLLNPETSVEDGVSGEILQLAVRYHMNEPLTAEELNMAMRRIDC